jgi:DNA-binding IclR family transcriptional regulator
MSSLDKGLRILGLLSKQRPVLRVGEVCRALEMPKSSASRLLRTMAQHGLLTQEKPDQGYVAGPRSFEIAGLYLGRHTLLDRLDEVIDHLVAEFGFVGYLCALEGPDLVILRRRHGHYPLRLVRDVGQRVPAFQTAAGRVLLAYTPDDYVRDVLSRDPDWGKRQALAMTEIRQIRSTGMVTAGSSVTPGVAATAAAVRDAASGETLAFSVSFPLAATDDAVRDRIAARMRVEAHRLGTLLGDRVWAAREAASGTGGTGRTAREHNPRLGAHHAETA